MRYILDELKGAKLIGITGHVRPDGDCIGSCMGLYHYLKNNLPSDTIIDLYLESVSGKLSVVPGTDLIKHEYDGEKQYDIFISLDSSSIDRLGFAMDILNHSVKTINIDHHISNTNFANVNHVIDHASSTCEVLFDLFDETLIDIHVATALYLGLIHDTGVFKHSNTTEKTLNIAGKLISKGVPFSRMIDETFYLKTYVQNQLLGRCLLESILVLDGKCIVSSINKKMLDFYDASSEDLDGIIDQLRVTDGTEVAIFVYETDFHEYKVSMRANNAVDVRKVAAYFGGGGHIKAAGCTMRGSLHDVINNLLIHIEHQLSNNSME